MDEQPNYQAIAIEAGRVFTPSSPVDEQSLFAGRKDQLRKVLDSINQKGQHCIIYGERGVGKTSMANVLASYLTPAQFILSPRVNCDSTDTFESVFKKLFDEIRLIQLVKVVGFNAQKSEDAVPLSDFGSTASPDNIRRILSILPQKSLTILILDEFDRLNRDTKRAVADLIKTLSDHSANATIVLVGVADSVDQLIEEHQSIDRALVQVQMPRMSKEEIRQIIENGIARLKMTIDPSATERIMLLSQGLPHYAHLLCLYSCRGALDNQSLNVNIDVVNASINRAIEGANQTIQTAWHRATSSPRKDNLFSKVLEACAMAQTDELGYFAMQDVRAPLRNITGKEYDIPSFAQHLNEFCDPKRGSVLTRTGQKRRHRYRFANPLMQPFVIMHGFTSGDIKLS